MDINFSKIKKYTFLGNEKKTKMKKYIIHAPHKCGSTIVSKILKSVFDLPRIKVGEDIVVNNDSGLMKLRFERLINPANPAKLVGVNLANDNFIFIPRNPIGITISMFYSFGYTHKCPAGFTQEQFESKRQKIQKEGLANYINRVTPINSKKIEKFWNLPATNKVILPYEFMIGNFSEFLKELLQTLDMASVYDKTYEKWKYSFAPIEDKSDLIEAGKLKSHKRTTDIYEWKKKLSNEEQSKLLSEFPFIQQYDDFLNKLL